MTPSAKKALRHLLIILLVGSGIFVLVNHGLLFWIHNQELTYIQVFLINWPWMILGIVLVFLGLAGLEED